MNQSMQSISPVTTTPTHPKGGRRTRPTHPMLGSVRSRFRSMRLRSTLGPSFGDHVLGETQWHSGGGA